MAKHDTVSLECDHCGREHKVKVMKGPRKGKTYTLLDEIPAAVMMEMDSYYWECKHCQWSNTVEYMTEPHLRVEAL